MTSWRDRIMEAQRFGGFTLEDKALAADWKTCVVGEVIKRRYNPIPDWVEAISLTPAVKEEGEAFLAAVRADDVVLAGKLYFHLDNMEVRDTSRRVPQNFPVIAVGNKWVEKK